MSRLVRAISMDGCFMVCATDTTDIVSRAEQIHQTSAVVTAALGRLLTAASMMGHQLKGKKDSITLRLKGDGPAGTFIVVGDSSGNVKGYVENSVVELPLNTYGKLDVSGAVGKTGTLSVIKDLGMREPYIGQIPIVSGEIAEDITHYYATSEQTPTVCGLGVLVNTDLTVLCAGGFLVQVMPGAQDSEITRLEENVSRLSSVTQMLSDGMTPEQICEQVLSGFDMQLLESAQCSYHCDCSRDRVERALVSLGKKELKEMAETQDVVEVCCHFCNKKYRFEKDEIEKLMQKGIDKGKEV